MKIMVAVTLHPKLVFIVQYWKIGNKPNRIPSRMLERL